MKIHIGPYSKTDKPRKVDIRIDTYDTWSMDHTLAMIIHPMLIQLKATKHGAPRVDNEDVPEELKSTSAPPLTQEEIDCGSIDSFHFNRWDWVLDEMIWAFAQVLDEDVESQFHTGEHDFDFVEVEGSEFSEIKYGPNHTHVFDREGYDVWAERKQNGFRLFGKYFQNLWD